MISGLCNVKTEMRWKTEWIVAHLREHILHVCMHAKNSKRKIL